jgi:hypothetical protein
MERQPVALAECFKANEIPTESITEDLSVYPVSQLSEIPTRPKEDPISDDDRQKYPVWPGSAMGNSETKAPACTPTAQTTAPAGTYPVWAGTSPMPRRQDDPLIADNVRQIYPVWPGSDLIQEPQGDPPIPEEVRHSAPTPNESE